MTYYIEIDTFDRERAKFYNLQEGEEGMRKNVWLLICSVLLVGMCWSCGKKEAEPQTQSGAQPAEMADSTRMDAAMPDSAMMDSSMMDHAHDSM